MKLQFFTANAKCSFALSGSRKCGAHPSFRSDCRRLHRREGRGDSVLRNRTSRYGFPVPPPPAWVRERGSMAYKFSNLWSDEAGQDIAEYSVMLAVVLIIVVGTVRLIGSNASNVFSQVGSSIR